MKKDKPELKLQAEKPKATQVNKPLVWGGFLIIVLVIAVVLVSALQTSKPQQEKISVSHDFTSVVPSAVSKLPSSYTDNLSAYLPKHKQTIPDYIKQQLASLQQEQSSLEQRLAALKKKPAPAPQPTTSPLNSQAMHSGMFFPGASPDTSKLSASTTATTTTTTKASTSSGSTEKQSSYQQQNMQSQKLSFLKNTSKDDSDIYNEHRMVAPISPYEVQAGTLIPAVLLTAVNTSLPGEVVARVRADVYSTVTGQFLLIPQGSKLIGDYDTQVSYGQRRVLIVFTRIIRPDGTSILLSKSPGSDLFGQAGMEGTVDNHWGRVIGSAVLSTILSLGTSAAASNSFPSNSDYYMSPGQNALLGAAGNLSSIGSKLTQQQMNIQPTLVLPTGYEFNIIVNKDMVLQPYDKASRQLPGSYHGVYYK